MLSEWIQSLNGNIQPTLKSNTNQMLMCNVWRNVYIYILQQLLKGQNNNWKFKVWSVGKIAQQAQLSVCVSCFLSWSGFSIPPLNYVSTITLLGCPTTFFCKFINSVVWQIYKVRAYTYYKGRGAGGGRGKGLNAHNHLKFTQNWSIRPDMDDLYTTSYNSGC